MSNDLYVAVRELLLSCGELTCWCRSAKPYRRVTRRWERRRVLACIDAIKRLEEHYGELPLEVCIAAFLQHDIDRVIERGRDVLYDGKVWEFRVNIPEYDNWYVVIRSLC